MRNIPEIKCCFNSVYGISRGHIFKYSSCGHDSRIYLSHSLVSLDSLLNAESDRRVLD